MAPLLTAATADAGSQGAGQGNEANDNGSNSQPTLGPGHAHIAVFGAINDGGQIGEVLHGADQLSGGRGGGGFSIAGCIWVLWCFWVAGHLRDHRNLDTGDSNVDVDNDEGLASDIGWAETHREGVCPQPGFAEQEPIAEWKDV